MAAPKTTAAATTTTPTIGAASSAVFLQTNSGFLCESIELQHASLFKFLLTYQSSSMDLPAIS
jgi:hypothetical protein